MDTQNYHQQLELKINQWLDSHGLKQSSPEEKKLDQFDQFRQKAFSLNQQFSNESSTIEKDNSEIDSLPPKSPQLNISITSSPLLQKRQRKFGKPLSIYAKRN